MTGLQGSLSGTSKTLFILFTDQLHHKRNNDDLGSFSLILLFKLTTNTRVFSSNYFL